MFHPNQMSSYFQTCPFPIHLQTTAFPKKTSHLISFALKYPFIHPPSQLLPTNPSILNYKFFRKCSLTSLDWEWFFTSGLPYNSAYTPMTALITPYVNSWLPVFSFKSWFPGGQRLYPLLTVVAPVPYTMSAKWQISNKRLLKDCWGWWWHILFVNAELC